MPVSRRTKVLICCTLGLAAVTLTRLPSLRRQAAIGAGPTTAPTDAPRAAPESHDSMDAAARDAAGPTFGLPTQLDPTGRSGLRRLDVSGPRRVLLKIGEWHELPPKPTEFAIGGMGWKRFPDEFCESSAARIGDAVYVIGGFLCDFNHVTDKVQILNRTTGEWRTAARLPETAAKTHQGAAAQTVAEATWLYLVSGQLGPGCTLGTAESWALKMHKRKAVWVRLPDLPEVRYAPSAFVDAGHLHVVGGAGPNRQDPRPEHWVLPLLESGRPAKAGWFDVGLLPGGGADSCGSATSRGYTFRFGGQHGHPHAVNVLTDNNAQCQRVLLDGRHYRDSPEVAHTLSMRRKLGDLGDVDWRIIAPLPWPASHVGLSTVAHGDNVLVVSGKDGKGATPRVASYDVVDDRWRSLRPVPFGQPDFLVWFDGAGHVHALKFKWHPTNTTLNEDYRSLTHSSTKRKIPFKGALTHFKAWVKYGNDSEYGYRASVAEAASAAVASASAAGASASAAVAEFQIRPLHEDFGAEVLDVNLRQECVDTLPRAAVGVWRGHKRLHRRPAAFGAQLRSLLDEHGLVIFRAGKRQLSTTELVALHALLDHDLDAAPGSFHKGMCRLWRAGLPQVNLLANRAVDENVTRHFGALADDGRPCVAGNIYGMESYAWHSDETARTRAGD